MPNITEISLQDIIYKIKDDSAASSTHNHSASEITSGTLSVIRGGTGVTSNPSMLTNLGSTTAANVFAASPRPGVTGTLPIANGGTGATTAAAARTSLGITPANIGAETSGAASSAVSSHNSATDAHSTLFNAKEDKPTSTSGTSTTVNITVANNTEYSYTNTRYFTLTGANVNCHGFVTFHSSYAPSITVSGFTASSGDDITKAAKGQVWEFSVYTHNSKSYIIWKNWSA